MSLRRLPESPGRRLFAAGLLAVALAALAAPAAAEVTVSAPEAREGDHGGRTLDFVVTITGSGTFTGFAYPWGGTATQDVDYVFASHDFSHTAGSTTTFTVRVAIRSDTQAETDETVHLQVARRYDSSGALVIGSGVGKILDDDGSNDNGRRITVAASTQGAEGDSGTRNVTFRIHLDRVDTWNTHTVSYSTANGTATAGSDYTATSGTVTFYPGLTYKDISVPVAGDTTPEGDETFHFDLGRTTVKRTKTRATYTILDEDTPTLTMDAGPSVTEGDTGETDATFTLRLDQASSEATTVTVRASSESGDTATAGTDYTGFNAKSVTFAAGDTVKTVTVKVKGEYSKETDETFTVKIVSVTTNNAHLGASRSATGTIRDDDNPAVLLDKRSLSLSPGNAGSYRVKLQKPPEGVGNVTVTPASSNTGKITVSGGPLVFTTTTWDAWQTVRVTASTTNTSHNVFSVTHSVSGANYGSVTAPTLEVPVSVPTKHEVIVGDGSGTWNWILGVAEGKTRTYTINLTSPPNPAGATVTITPRSENTSKFTVSGAVTFDHTNYHVPQTVTVTGVEDNIVGNSHANAVKLRHRLTGNATNYNSQTRGLNDTNVFLRDGDKKAKVTLSDAGAIEGNGLTFTATLDVAVANGFSVTPTYTAGTALQTSDYTENTTAITFSGTAGETKTFTVSTVEDTTKESTETFTVGLSTTHSKVITTDTAVATIHDDDGPAVTLTVSASTATVAEDGSAETVTVTAATANSNTFTESKTIKVTVGGGTATEGTDYSTVNDFNVTLAAGSTSATGTFTLTPIDDSIVEGREDLGVNGAVIGVAVSGTTIGITDDESASATLTATPAKVRERDGATLVTVKAALAGGFFTSDQTVTVAVGKSGDTATEGTDYNTVQGFDLKVKSGYSTATGTFTLTPKSDNTAEGAEAVSVSGTATAFAVAAASVAIDDTNKAPTANAGPDQTVDEGDTVTLAGSGTDPEKGTLTYAWTAPTGITLSDTTVTGPTFTAPSQLAADTDYEFTLTVTDDGNNTGTDTVKITVTAGTNDAPTADAGDDQTVDEGDTVTLDGSGSSDPEGETLTYTWSQTSGTTVTLSSTSDSGPTFTAPDLTGNETLTFSLTVSDARGLAAAAADTVDITVRADNDAPTASAGSDQTVAEGATVTLAGSGTDPEGATVTYAWSQTGTPAVTLSNTTAAGPTFTAPDVSADTDLVFSLTVNDGTNDSAADTVTITVDAAPTANAGSDQTANEGVEVTLDGSASSDPGGGTITYSWAAPTGVSLDSATAAKPKFTTATQLVSNQDLTFTLTVTDSSSQTATDDVKVTVTAGSNDAPTANAGPDQTVDEGATVTLDGSGSSDPEGETLSYAWTQTSGTTVTLSSTTVAGPTFTAPNLTANETLTFSLTVTDARNLASASADTVDITVTADNDAPTANAGPDQNVNEGAAVTLDGSGSSDPEGTTLTYAWTQTSGTTVNLTGGTTSGPTFTAPELSANETLTFSLTVSDGTNTSAADTVDVVVAADDDAPTANAGTDQTVAEGATVTLSGSGTDPEGETLTYAWTQTGTPAVTLSDTTAAGPTFTAPSVTADTDLVLSLTVNDGTNDSAADTVTITVDAAPTANAGADQSVNENTEVELDGSGSSDPGGGTITYSWAAPTGVTFTSGSTTAKPKFTTANQLAANQDLTFTLTVTDSRSQTATDDVKVTVTAGSNDAPTANAGPDQTVNEGDTVTLDGSGSNDPEGETITYAWTQTAGTTVTLSGTAISGPTFTAPDLAANETLTFSLTVTDARNLASAADTVDITVTADNDAPTAKAGPDQTVNEGDSVTLDGSGSSDPEGEALSYAWTAPSDVTLTGADTSGPTFTAPSELVANKALEFSLVVTDVRGAKSSADTVTVTVTAGTNDAPTAEAGDDQTVIEGATVTLAGSGTDPENQTLTYAWTQTTGTTVPLSGTDIAGPTFTAPDVTANEDLTFSLTVNDGVHDSAADTVTITVDAVPTANAGPDQTDVAEGATVTLDGSGSADPGGGTLTYEWLQTSGPTMTLSDTTVAKPTFTADDDLLETQTLEFSLTVTDSRNQTDTDTVTITVAGTNDAPTADAGEDQTVDEGVEVTLDGSKSSDPEEEDLTYAWTQTAGTDVTLIGATTSGPTFTAPDLTADETLTFSLTVNDGTSDSAADTVDITVTADDDAPTADAGEDQTVDEGAAVSLDGSGSSDPEGKNLSYAWTQTAGSPTVDLTNEDQESATFTAPTGLTADAALTFTLTVTDPGNNAATDDVVVTVTARPRLVVSPTKVTVAEGATDTYKIRLGTAPAGPVTVTPQSDDTGAATVSPATLTFTKDTWSTDQTVTVTGVEDDDGADESVPVIHAVSGYGTVTTGPPVTVTVTDPDTVTANVVVDPATLDIQEGKSKTYTAKLHVKPEQMVTVTPASADPTHATVQPASLTFTQDNWNTAQTVTVSTVKDDDAESEKVEITHSVTGADAKDQPSVTVTILDTPPLSDPREDDPVNPDAWAPTIHSVAADDRALTPSWSNPAAAGAVAAHEVEYYRADYTEPPETAKNGPETWYRIEDLENGVEYEMRVRTTAADHVMSGWSEPARGTPFRPDYPPSLLEVEIVSTPPHDPWYGIGDEVRIAVRFDEEVFVSPEKGAPWIELMVGKTKRRAEYASGHGRSRLHFRYVVKVGDLDEDGVSIERNALRAGAGGIVDASDQEADLKHGALPDDPAHLVDGLPPYLVDIAVVSRPAKGDAYRKGETIRFGLTFDERVTVSADPVFPFDVGGYTRFAALEDTDGAGERFGFRYRVGAEDWDDDGISYAKDMFRDYGGGVIEDRAGNAARRAHPAMADNPRHKVRGLLPPTLSGLADLTLIVGEDPEDVSLLGARRAESFVAASSAPAVAPVELDGRPVTAAVSLATIGPGMPAAQPIAAWDATTLTVTPLREGETTVRVVAWNRAGHASDEFQVTVITDPAETEALEGTLEAYGRAMLSSASMTIGRRLESGGGGGESRMSLSSPDQAGEMPFGGDAAGLAALSRNRALFLNEAPFGAGNTGLDAPGAFFNPMRDSFEISLTDEDGMAAERGLRWGLWGAGQMQTFDGGGDADAAQFSGSLVSPYVGLDLSGERFVAGVAMSREIGRSDYAFRGETTGSGTLDLNLASAYPYARYRFGTGTEVWGIAGFGGGEAEVQRDHTGTTETSGVAMRMGMAGLRQEVGSFSGMQLAVRGDGGIVNLEAGTRSGVLRDISATASRVRLGLEGSFSRMVGENAVLTPFGEVAGRRDGGEQVSGTGLEFAGGLRLEGGSRLSVEAQGRVLAMHTASEYGEKGFSVRAELRPREDERGLSLSLAPRWGAMAQGAETLWRDDPRMFGGDGAFGFDDGGEVRGLVAWGMAAPWVSGVLTPFTEMTTRALGRSVRFGVRYSLSDPQSRMFQLELAGERTDSIEGVPDYRGSVFATWVSGAAVR